MEAGHHREAWNKGKLIGQKPPLKPKDIWAIRINLQNAHAVRDLAMFNLAIDSKLRGCDLVNLHVRDVMRVSADTPIRFGGVALTRARTLGWPFTKSETVQVSSRYFMPAGLLLGSLGRLCLLQMAACWPYR